MRFYITADTAGWTKDVDYCIYFGDIYDFDSDLNTQIAKLKALIDDKIAEGKADDIDFAECQVTSVPLFVDEDGHTDYDWDNEEVEYCADADDDYAAYVNATSQDIRSGDPILASWKNDEMPYGFDSREFSQYDAEDWAYYLATMWKFSRDAYEDLRSDLVNLRGSEVLRDYARRLKRLKCYDEFATFVGADNEDYNEEY